MVACRRASSPPPSSASRVAMYRSTTASEPARTPSPARPTSPTSAATGQRPAPGPSRCSSERYQSTHAANGSGSSFAYLSSVRPADANAWSAASAMREAHRPGTQRGGDPTDRNGLEPFGVRELDRGGDDLFPGRALGFVRSGRCCSMPVSGDSTDQSGLGVPPCDWEGRAADKRELVAERSEIFAKKLRAAFRTLR